MPYNTAAIPPRKEPTGHTQLPLSRVKKIISQDSDIGICSNNAAFVITLATEMFVQRLAGEAHTQARLERKPRRNIQYKDVANAVSHQDNLEFLEDIVPKTVPLKKIRATASATQARLRGDKLADERPPTANGQMANGSGGGVGGGAGSSSAGKMIVNGEDGGSTFSVPGRAAGHDGGADDPNEQLEMEMRQAAGSNRDGDVDMTG